MNQGYLRITRVAANPDEGTFATFVLNGQPICVSVEPYSRNNATGRSCIPAGQYYAKKYNSPQYGLVWMLRDTEGRDFIEIHWGNFDHNTLGCIIVGEKFEVLSDKWAVLESKKAFNEFMTKTKDYDSLLITITEAY